MATKKLCVNLTQRKALLKELNQTEESMDALWEDALTFNPLCRAFLNSGMGWRDMNSSCMRSLVTVRSNHDKRQAEKKALEAASVTELLKRLATSDTRSEEQKLIDRITAGDKLSERELYDLTDYEVEGSCGETENDNTHYKNSRWGNMPRLSV